MGDPLGKKTFSIKILTMPTKQKGDRLISPVIVRYAEKDEKPFWFSSQGQMIQFGTIKLCRTFKNYFGQFVWIEKSHYNSRDSLHGAPTKNQNNGTLDFTHHFKINTALKQQKV